MRSLRAAVTRFVAAMLTLALMGAAFFIAPAQAAGSCTTASGYWAVVDGPPFTIGSSAIIDMAIDVRTHSTFVTNGTQVMRAPAGTCSWKQIYQLPETPTLQTPYARPTSRIASVTTPVSTGGRVILAIQEAAVNVMRPHILTSADDGTTWTPGDATLPPVGSLAAVAIAPSAPSVVYAGIDQGGGTIDSLYRSTDGGATWQPATHQVNAGVTGVTVDTLNPQELWAYGTSGLYHSTDGGSSYTAVDDFTGKATSPVDVFHRDGAARVVGFIPQDRYLLRSDDGGKTWLGNYAPGAVDSVGHLSIADAIGVTAGGKAYGYAPALFRWVDLKAPLPGVLDASGDPTKGFYFHTASKVLVYSGPIGPDFNVKQPGFDIPDVSLIDPPPFVSEPPTLTPGTTTVKIPAGKTKKVRYTLDLSKTKTPLDLYFLVDTSESSKPFLQGLALVIGDVVRGLYNAGVDARFGLGEFRAYPDSDPPRPSCGNNALSITPGQCERNFVYRRDLDIPNYSAPALEHVLQTLEPLGGGHYNSQLSALYQTATGAGEDVYPPNPAGSPDPFGNDVPPGQQADFRDKALRVVLMASDEEFVDPPYANDKNPPDIPSFAQVNSALSAKGIHQVGLSLGRLALNDIRKVASGTGTVAPSQGVDCDGDGRPDLAPGAALVCEVDRNSLSQGSNLVPAIVNLVEAVRSHTAVTLQATGRDGVVADVAPAQYPAVVLQSDNTLDFSITYKCPLEMAGKKTTIDLAAHNATSVLARATTQVVCGKLPPHKKSFFAPLITPLITIVPILPLAPPPSMAQPTSSTQAQSQAQGQGAFAAQEQQQPQVAFATAYKRALKTALETNGDDFAMSSFRDRTSPSMPPGLFIATIAGMAALAYVTTLAPRRRFARSRRR